MDRELERLDQEITLELQKIDGNLSHCFDVITKQVIPRVVAYGQVCDAISDSCEWLGTLCKSSGVVDLKRDVLLERTPVRDSDAHGNAHGDTHGNAHGDAHGEANAERSYGDVPVGKSTTAQCSRKYLIAPWESTARMTLGSKERTTVCRGRRRGKCRC